jgi:Fe2+ or Zn2+ uptake regulation protein
MNNINETTELVLPEIVVDTLNLCRRCGLRSTKALRQVIHILAKENKPCTLKELLRHELLSCQADHATLYRMMTKLAELGVVNQLGLRQRAAFYVLAGKNRDGLEYAVCKDDDQIYKIKLDLDIKPILEEVARQTGLKDIQHELVFYGKRASNS